MVFLYGNVHLNQALNVLQVGALFLVNKGPRDATQTCTARSSNAVNVGFGDVWNFKIDDVREFVNVDAPSRNVRGDKNTRFAGLKIAQGVLTRILALVAVNGLGGYTGLYQILHHAICAVFGAGEDEDGRNFLRTVLQQIAQQEALGLLVYEENSLLNRLRGGGNGCNGNANGIVQQLVAQGYDFFGHSGRKEERLTLLRQLGDDLLDVVDEAHVEHSVRFVQHEVRQLL